MNRLIKHAECYSRGTPDRICDFLAEAIVDLYLARDPNAVTSIHVQIGRGKVILSGGVYLRDSAYSSVAYSELEFVVHRVLRSFNFDDFKELTIVDNIHEVPVSVGNFIYNGIVHGSATNETPNHLPLAQKLACDLMYNYDYQLGEGSPILKRSAFAQVRVDRDEGFIQPNYITLGISHSNDFHTLDVKVQEVVDSLVNRTLVDYMIDRQPRVVVNRLSTSERVIDLYGASARRVDLTQLQGFVSSSMITGTSCNCLSRFGSYFSRYLAKHLVEAGVADVVTLSLAYAEGYYDRSNRYQLPLSVDLEMFGNKSQMDADDVSRLIQKVVSFNPEEIIQRFRLRTVSHKDYMNYSHYFDANAPWEQIDPELVKVLQQVLL